MSGTVCPICGAHVRDGENCPTCGPIVEDEDDDDNKCAAKDKGKKGKKQKTCPSSGK